MLGVELWITQTVSVLTTLSHCDVFCISNRSNSVPYRIILLSIFFGYFGHDQFIVLSHVLDQHTLRPVRFTVKVHSCTIICICHSLFG